jgi:hypothetical protein
VKIRDRWTLSLLEFSYDKKEWILSVTLHAMVFACVIFLSTVACEVNGVVGKSLNRYYKDGYVCKLRGYTLSSSKELETMGFTNLIEDEGFITSGTLDSLENIIRYKIKALTEDKDIFCMDMEESIRVIFFVQIVFFLLALVLFMLMCGNLANACAIKISKRENYIRMLTELGMSKKACSYIYVRFFLIRNAMALLIAVGLNALVMIKINRYMKEAMNFNCGFRVLNINMICLIAVLSLFFMIIIIREHWREYET